MSERALIELNEAFAGAEQGRDDGFFRRVLADDLVFRRASGVRVGKEAYLADLLDEENAYDQLVAEDVEAVVADDTTALVSLRVRASGTRAGAPFEGAFRNTRLFVERDGTWQCVVWFNTRE